MEILKFTNPSDDDTLESTEFIFNHNKLYISSIKEDIGEYEKDIIQVELIQNEIDSLIEFLIKNRKNIF
jgi:hypothetical protein